MSKIIMILIGSAMLIACGGNEPVTQNGSDFFADMAEPACDRLLECGFYPPNQYGDCTNAFVLGACDGAGYEFCGSEFTVSGSDYDDCMSGWDDLSCAGINAGLYPEACVNMFDS